MDMFVNFFGAIFGVVTGLFLGGVAIWLAMWMFCGILAVLCVALTYFSETGFAKKIVAPILIKAFGRGTHLE